MTNNLPATAFGHFVMKVNDVDISYKFYTKFGLRPIGIFPDAAIIELRGGTHILLFNKNDELPFSLSPSHLGVAYPADSGSSICSITRLIRPKCA